LQLTPVEAPQTVSVITQHQIDDQALVSVNDALDFAVGISFRASSSANPEMHGRR
jgi:outer membrane receptor for ferric coprogen and ferric-rhodotorulic acid